MARMRRLWVPVLVGLLVAVLLGPAGGAAVTAVEPRTVTASIMVPAGAFSPRTDNEDYYNNGVRLEVVSGSGTFVAPLWFPVPEVRIRRITLYAYDNGAGEVGVEMYRTVPSQAAGTVVGGVVSTDGADDPGVFATTDITPRGVNTAVHGSHLELYLSDPSVRCYGVKVTFTYETGA